MIAAGFQLDDAALQRCVLRPQARGFTARGRALLRKLWQESAKLPYPIYQLSRIGDEVEPRASIYCDPFSLANRFCHAIDHGNCPLGRSGN